MANRRYWGFGLQFLVAAIVLTAIVLLVNRLAAGLRIGRFDLTDGRIYTMSEASKEILSDLKVDVRLKLYITRAEKMPAGLKNLERDVVDKLEEFRLASNGKLTYEVFDPSDNPELIKKLEEKEIFPFEVQTFERDALGLKLVYSSMVISYLERDEIIPRLLPTMIPSLEYEVLSRVYRLTMAETPKVALVAPVDEVDPQLAQMLRQMGRPVPPSEDSYRVVEQLLQREKYNVVRTEIGQGNTIPADARTLLVVDPRSLNERQRWEIARAIQGGMNAVFAVQKTVYGYNTRQRSERRGGLNLEVTPQRNETELDDLLRAYGVTVDGDLFMDNRKAILQISTEASFGGMPMMMRTPVELPVQILVTGDQMNRDLSITSRIASLLYLWGTRLKTDRSVMDGAGLKETLLFTSSPESWTVPFRNEPLTAEDITSTEFLGPQTLAILLEGQFPNPYAGEPRPEWPEPAQPPPRPMPPDPPEEPADPKPARVIVIGSGRMFDNNGIAADSNRFLLLNAVDALSLGDRLIRIRAKTVEERRIEKNVEPSRKMLYRVAVMFTIPVLFSLFGVVRYVVRRRLQGAPPPAAAA